MYLYEIFLQIKRVVSCLTREGPDDVQKYQCFEVKTTVSLHCVLRKHNTLVKTPCNLNFLLEFYYFQEQKTIPSLR